MEEFRQRTHSDAQRLAVKKIKDNLSSFTGMKMEVPNVSLDSFIGLPEIKREMLETIKKGGGRQRILLFGVKR